MDWYRHRLAHAQWTWRENSTCPYHKTPRIKKDRLSGRAEKRKARQQEKRDREEP